jgi:hypothetical protein
MSNVLVAAPMYETKNKFKKEWHQPPNVFLNILIAAMGAKN